MFFLREDYNQRDIWGIAETLDIFTIKSGNEFFGRCRNTCSFPKFEKKVIILQTKSEKPTFP